MGAGIGFIVVLRWTDFLWTVPKEPQHSGSDPYLITTGGRSVTKVDLSYLVYKWTLLPALLAATNRIHGVKSGLLRFFGVSLVASLMTRWWLFRACNNPAPAENGTNNTGDHHIQQVSPVAGCCTTHCCAYRWDKGPKCNYPTIPVSSSNTTTTITTNNHHNTTLQNTSQQCESVRTYIVLCSSNPSACPLSALSVKLWRGWLDRHCTCLVSLKNFISL